MVGTSLHFTWSHGLASGVARFIFHPLYLRCITRLRDFVDRVAMEYKDTKLH